MRNKNNNKYTKKYLNENIKILKDNEVYRICDLLKFKKTYPLVKRLLKNDIYKDSIMRNFFESNDNERFKIKKLYNISKNFLIEKKIKVYDDSYLVIHIRTGDDLYKRGLYRNFYFYLNNILKRKNIKKKVVIVTAMHYGNSNKKHRLYNTNKWLYSNRNKIININLLYRLIYLIPNEVIICSNSDVDIDLIKLTFSKNVLFCNNAGGFAQQVNNLHNLYLHDKNIKILDENIIKNNNDTKT